MIGPERQLTPATHAVMETIKRKDIDPNDVVFYHEGPAYCGDGYYGVNWCGMFLGIENDGYAHS